MCGNRWKASLLCTTARCVRMPFIAPAASVCLLAHCKLCACAVASLQVRARRPHCKHAPPPCCVPGREAEKCLYPHTKEGMQLLTKGIERAKEMAVQIVEQGGLALTRKQVQVRWATLCAWRAVGRRCTCAGAQQYISLSRACWVHRLEAATLNRAVMPMPLRGRSVISELTGSGCVTDSQLLWLCWLFEREGDGCVADSQLVWFCWLVERESDGCVADSQLLWLCWLVERACDGCVADSQLLRLCWLFKRACEWHVSWKA